MDKLYKPEELTDEQKLTMLPVVVDENDNIIGASTCKAMTQEYTEKGIIRYQLNDDPPDNGSKVWENYINQNNID